MEEVEQLKLELTQVQEKKLFFEEQLKHLGECIKTLQKEVAYRTN